MTLPISLVAKLACGFIAIILCFTALVQAEDIAVFNLRIDIPNPDGSGVAFIQLKHDESDPNHEEFTGFRIKALNFIETGSQQLKLWNSADSNCDGEVLDEEDTVPEDGKVCFFSDNSVDAEFQNSFDFVATATGGDSTLMGTVKLVNYNKQICPGIPDLGTSGSFSAPPAPTINIELEGLQIKFTVDTPYIRNETSWFLDFFEFDISPGGHSANGEGHTCANHKPANFGNMEFGDWWASAPRATYNTAVHASIENALNNPMFPNYYPDSTEWSVSAVNCGKVTWTATIPVSKLIRNTGNEDCKPGTESDPAATPTSPLQFAGQLYANAIRPRDLSDEDGGYFKSTFLFPFTFRIQETVSNVGTISPKWSFAVNILSLDVERKTDPALTLDIQTTLDHPSFPSPDITTNSFALLASPNSGVRGAPTLTRVGDNSQCTGLSTSACIITWRLVAPEIPDTTLDDPEFGLQYVGNWQLQWTTTDGDVLQANIYIDALATDPDIGLGELPVESSISFFKSKEDMQNVNNPGIASPTYSSGEKIWVRHSFEVDDADVTALTFTLKEAHVCWSHVPGFVPSLNGGLQGCKSEIPGVMEASQGQRIVLYDAANGGGIANVPGNSAGVQPKIWDWELVGPASGWSGNEHVHSGFGINTLPLVTDDQTRSYYFHVISVVSQTTPDKRSSSSYERHSIYTLRNGVVERGWLQGVSIEGSDSDAAHALRPSAAISWLY